MTKVALLALENCYITALGGMSAILLLANKLNRATDAKSPPFMWKVVSLEGGAVRTGTRITILSEDRIGEEYYDAICIPTLYYLDKEHFMQQIDQHKALYPWLQRQWQQGATIVANGTGTFLLAESGLLEGRRATTVHWLAERFQHRYPKVRLQKNALISEDDRLLCSSAPTSYLRLAQKLVTLFMGSQIASQCAKAILLDSGLSGESAHMPQYIDTSVSDPLVNQINHWLDQHLSDKSGVDELANVLAMSVRTLSRHFQKELGVTPAVYIQQRRLEAARLLLESTTLSIYEVAQRVGYSDSSSFSRVFSGHLGITPAVYRNQYRITFA